MGKGVWVKLKQKINSLDLEGRSWPLHFLLAKVTGLQNRICEFFNAER
jgi:hypothetical protein